MSKWRNLVAASVVAMVGLVSATASAHGPHGTLGDDPALVARERAQLEHYLARLDAQECATLERYIWTHRLDWRAAARARAYLAEKQRIRDEADFRRLEAKQALRAARHDRRLAYRGW